VLGSVAFRGETDRRAAQRILSRCLEHGLNWIDTAAGYGSGASESAIGAIVADLGQREKVVIATKFGLAPPAVGATAAEIAQAVTDEVEGSLRRLNTDYIDLLQLHRPWFDVRPDAILEPVAALVAAGKVRRFGSSNFPSWLLSEFRRAAAAGGRPIVEIQQSPYNLLDRRIENELVSFTGRNDIALMTWSPTASGMLSGRYRFDSPVPADSRANLVDGFTDRLTAGNLGIVDALGQRAKELDLTLAQLALAWVRMQPGVDSVIIGPRTEAHLADALAVLDLPTDVASALAGDPVIDAIVPPGGYVIDFATLSRPS
jgi:aryl-alcohol dehydrogenase-like predicted oxidoreductase